MLISNDRNVTTVSTDLPEVNAVALRMVTELVMVEAIAPRQRVDSERSAS